MSVVETTYLGIAFITSTKSSPVIGSKASPWMCQVLRPRSQARAADRTTEMLADIVMPIGVRPPAVHEAALGVLIRATRRLHHPIQRQEFRNDLTCAFLTFQLSVATINIVITSIRRSPPPKIDKAAGLGADYCGHSLCGAGASVPCHRSLIDSNCRTRVRAFQPVRWQHSRGPAAHRGAQSHPRHVRFPRAALLGASPPNPFGVNSTSRTLDFSPQDNANCMGFQASLDCLQEARHLGAVADAMIGRERDLHLVGHRHCPSLMTGTSLIEPIARIAACGGLMIATNSETSNIPRLLIVKVPPWYSSGSRPPLRARPTDPWSSARSCPASACQHPAGRARSGHSRSPPRY